ncbi:MAG: threonine ammonia-lyase, biosynthetic [Thiohalomonadales bacterium]
MLETYFRKIEASAVYDVAQRTPLQLAIALSERLNNQIYLKREDTQPVFSFKIRGAYNKIAGLSQSHQQRGVITASAGNHAQGVALAAQRLKIDALIVMPKTTPSIKIDSVRRRNARIELVGNTYDEAYVYAKEVAAKTGMTFVHPYNDPEVIAGQGTVAAEILEQLDTVDMIFVPVGGGGLLAGITAYVKYVKPSIKVIGVEPHDAACLHAAMAAKKRVVLDHVGLFADGVAVAQVGEEPYRVVKDLVDDVLTVNTDEICAAIKDIFEDTRSVCEAAGALAVAGMKNYIAQHNIKDLHIVAIDSGANINFDRLRHVAERAELGEQREALFSATIPERPGSFRSFCDAIGLQGITEFSYRYADNAAAHVFVGVKLRQGGQEFQALLQKLQQLEYPVVDLSQDEMAKVHIRYMVGGRSDSIQNERLFRFEFPERPGALLRFLNRMGERWNISLFHYRNHGAAYGRALVGIQVPAEDQQELQKFLQDVAYKYTEESDNPAYQLFLR